MILPLILKKTQAKKKSSVWENSLYAAHFNCSFCSDRECGTHESFIARIWVDCLVIISEFKGRGV